MEVSGQIHVPAALTPGKKSLVPIGQLTAWVPRLRSVRSLISPSSRRSDYTDGPAGTCSAGVQQDSEN